MEIDKIRRITELSQKIEGYGGFCATPEEVKQMKEEIKDLSEEEQKWKQ